MQRRGTISLKAILLAILEDKSKLSALLASCFICKMMKDKRANLEISPDKKKKEKKRNI